VLSPRFVDGVDFAIGIFSERLPGSVTDELHRVVERLSGERLQPAGVPCEPDDPGDRQRGDDVAYGNHLASSLPDHPPSPS